MAEKWPNVADERVRLFGDYELDLARGCLLRANQPVHLRPQAYEVLRYLVEHPGRLIGKDQLIQMVWHGRAVGDDSLVQCLRDVRQALGEDGIRVIRNVRGRGYIFDTSHIDDSKPATATDRIDFVRVVIEEHESEADEVGHAGSGEVAPQNRMPRDLVLRGAARPERSIRPSSRTLLLAVALLAAGGLAYGLLGRRTAPVARIQSIAVLPFENETGESDAEYLADGSTESLINSLAQIPALTVKARSTVFRYRGTGLTPQQIAAELSVQALIYGRIVRRANQLTVYLSLVDGRNGNQLWGEQYTRELDALPALERQIAEDVVHRLEASASGASGTHLTAGYTPRTDAYLLYLRGQYHRFKTTEGDLRAAIDYFTRAIAADHTYAPAYVGLAEASRARAIVGHVPSLEAFPQARAAAIRALELDDRLVDAHIALGWIRFSFDWDWVGAERELERAIELHPENAEAHLAYAHLLSNQGRHGEALLEAARARELDPRSLLVNALEGQFLFYAGRFDAAETRIRKTLEIDPNYWVAYQGLGRVHILRNEYPEAVAELRKAADISGRTPEPMMQLGYALARAGQHDEARALLQELQSRSSKRYVPAYSFAMILNGLGETDAALRRLEQSVDQREVQATFIKIDMRWDAVRTDPRFVALLERMNLS